MRRAPFTIILLPAPPSATRRCLQDMEAIRTSGDEILIIAPDGEDPALRRRFPWAASIPAYQGHGTRDLVLFLHPDVVMSRHAAAALAEAMTDESIVAVGPRMEAATNEGQSISDPDYHPMREADVRNFARQWRQMHPTPPRGVATLSEFCLLTRRRFLPADGPSRVEDVAALLDGMAQERGRLAVADGAFVHRYRHWLLADQAARTLSGPRVSVCLIVKDEEQHLPECLASLSGIADEIVVYDTGSTDATVDIARRAGARVVDGYWDDDFGRARNDAVSHCSGEWVLWLDADERLVGDVPALRHLLAQPLAVEGFLVNIDNLQGNEIASRSSHRALRIFRRCRGRWEGRLHEQIVAVDSHNGLTVAVLEPVHLVHLGYLATTMTERNKLERNLRLALADVESPDGESRALKLQNVGRSLAALGRHDEALEYLNRSLAAATLPLVRRLSNRVGAEVLLALGRHDEALEWVDRLRALSERGDLADVLEAKICLAKGEYQRVVELLDGLGDEGGIDDDGSTVDPAQYAVDKANAYVALNRHGEAADVLLAALRAHGRLDTHLGVLADVLKAADRELDEIATALPEAHRTTFIAQLLQLAPPKADAIIEALYRHQPARLDVLAAAARVAPRLDLTRALEWSVRLRARGLESACPVLAAARDTSFPILTRAQAAAVAVGAFADSLARDMVLRGMIAEDDPGHRELWRAAASKYAPALLELMTDGQQPSAATLA